MTILEKSVLLLISRSFFFWYVVRLSLIADFVGPMYCFVLAVLATVGEWCVGQSNHVPTLAHL